MTIEIRQQTQQLIDDLKSVCATYGLGNDGNEFKIITQVFLYKYLNDKFLRELKKEERFAKSKDLVTDLQALSEGEYNFLMLDISENTAKFYPHQLIPALYKAQNDEKFAETFDKTLQEIASQNNEIFSVLTQSGEKIVLFEALSRYIVDDKDAFCKAIVNKLVEFSFEDIFDEKFDFFAQIFEYLIKDYNSNSGGKYAEYFTPYAVSKIMARCLAAKPIDNVTCYDPSAGSGTLLMNLAHQIGEDNCMIYSQDISQKSSHLLRLNLIINNLVHSIHNVVKGNTILAPYHKDENGRLMQFDYIVSNPPFKLDFSDWRNQVDNDANSERFFAGVPNIPKKKKESMAIYQLFLQHILYSMSPKGKSAVVVPTGFLTAGSIDAEIRKSLVDKGHLVGVVSMPSNIFANTGTNVSVVFMSNEPQEKVVLIDASNLGETVKEDKNQKTVLTSAEEEQIIATFLEKNAVEDFSVVVANDEIKAKNYSFSAGQYFDIKIDYVDITHEEFMAQLSENQNELKDLFQQSADLEKEIQKNLNDLGYNG